jgi:pimeloyl-ACP methyl ester carboxylesterase
VVRYDFPDFIVAIEDLKRRVDGTRWPSSIFADDWSRGVPKSYLQSVAHYWVHAFDWELWQARLSRMPHFRTEIEGQPIHFLHYRSKRHDAMPLVMTHGWPSSFMEFDHVVPTLLKGNSEICFNLVIPSLPGFGFSSPLQSFGWNHRTIAAAWGQLMSQLGYERFGACGGDTGSLVAPAVGKLFPERVVGVHINGGLLRPDLTADEYLGLRWDERRRIDFATELLRLGTGYADIQATRPQSVGFALTDSPVGLLAWIIEKFKEWTDPEKPLPEEALDLDDILSTVSLYWLTDTAASSANLYYEVRAEKETMSPLPLTGVPTGIAVFPTDPVLRHRADREFNVVHWNEYNRGGHFAAIEAPDLYAADLIAFFHSLERL